MSRRLARAEGYPPLGDDALVSTPESEEGRPHAERIRVIGRALNNAVARAPWLWPVLKSPDAPLLRPLGARAGTTARGAGSSEHLAALAAGLLHVTPAPERALDLGTGTGEAALLVAREFPRASVRGVDVSEAMIAEAKAKVGLDPEGRIAFKVADAADLPWPDDSFDLVVQLNVPLFFAEIARVLRPGGHVVVAASWGEETPFFTPRSVLARGFAKHGIAEHVSGRRGPRHLLGRAPRRLTRRPRNRFRSMSDATHTLLVNPSAGGGRTQQAPRDHARAALADGGIEPRSSLPRTSSTAAARRAWPPSAASRVLVMSGDGLIGQVGGELANTGAAMGIIPGGRGNDFARVLGIPDDVEEAAGIIAAGADPADRRRRGERRPLPLHRELRLRLGGEPDRERVARQRPARLRLRRAQRARRLEARDVHA